VSVSEDLNNSDWYWTLTQAGLLLLLLSLFPVNKL